MQRADKLITSKKIYEGITAAIVWFSLVLQFYLSTGTISNFFSFFTILCNLLIAISLTFTLFAPASRIGLFFSKLSVQSAIALYIFIVAVVYNTVLRGLYPLTGWSWIVDNLLHVINPVLYIIYWFAFRPKGRLLWKDGLYWILFPLVYLIYSLIRGAIIHWYPYPFLNTDMHGYSRVSINVAVMISVFFIAGIFLIAITRFIGRKK